MAVLRCKSPFSVRIGGVPRVVAAGELIQDTDPAYKGRENLFEAVDTFVDRIAAKRVDRVMPVEAATAEPGEMRALPKRSRKPKSVGEIED